MVKVTRAFGDTRAWLGGTYGREAQYSRGGLLAVEPVIAGLVGVGWPLDDRSALRLDGVVERRDGVIGVPGYLRFSTSVAWTNKL